MDLIWHKSIFPKAVKYGVIPFWERANKKLTEENPVGVLQWEEDLWVKSISGGCLVLTFNSEEFLLTFKCINPMSHSQGFKFKISFVCIFYWIFYFRIFWKRYKTSYSVPTTKFVMLEIMSLSLNLRLCCYETFLQHDMLSLSIWPMYLMKPSTTTCLKWTSVKV